MTFHVLFNLALALFELINEYLILEQLDLVVNVTRLLQQPVVFNLNLLLLYLKLGLVLMLKVV